MRVVLAYKNFAANKNISHIGLGVAGLNNAKTLNAEGIYAEVWPIVDVKDLMAKLEDEYIHGSKTAITHVIISAPWIPTLALHELTQEFSRVHFAVNCHSNVGFLQADPNGMKLLREGLHLEMAVHNFAIAANCEKMALWVRNCFGRPCVVLPNLYYLGDQIQRLAPQWDGGTLRLGCFGAVRPQKNLASAVAAALEISFELKAETEIWVSAGRSEGGGLTVMNTVREMVKNVPGVSLKESGWQTWPEFRRTIGAMHLLLQPSYTESFNMVTADGIAEGVPSVVSEAITWVPPYWQACSDEVMDIARVGRALILDRRAARDGYLALDRYVSDGAALWKKWLSVTEKDR